MNTKDCKTVNVRSLVILFVATAAVAQFAPNQKPSVSDAALEGMIAAGKSAQELAQYVFDTHGCKRCHTIGHDGKLGFTDQGKERAKGFEGCIKMLTAMTVIVQVADDKRTPQQRDKAQRFAEFGCTSCHKVQPGKLGLTDVGAKLQHLHLGCVDVEKLVSAQAGPGH